MLNYQKIQSPENTIENFNTIPHIKTKEIIKLNLGVAYFIVLAFLVLKLLFT
jgi:hypothetical protein